MTPILCYHATRRSYRTGIITGLRPLTHVFNDDIVHHHHSKWCAMGSQDLWEVAYIGPARPDPLVGNGLILLYPAKHVTLVTGHK